MNTTEPLLDPALQQWLAVQVGDSHLALSVTWVASVFRPAAADAQSAPSVIDVVVHAGTPVFLTDLGHFFNEPAFASPHPSDLNPWVVVWHQPEDPLMGFRVEHVKGPFHAVVKDGHVAYEGGNWRVPVLKQVRHA